MKNIHKTTESRQDMSYTLTEVTNVTNRAYEYLLSRLHEQRVMAQDGGVLRYFSGVTCESLVTNIWNDVSRHYTNVNATILKGDEVPIIIDDGNGGVVRESVDQHGFINGQLVLAIECKTYLDKCYMQRADSDFALMKQANLPKYATWIVSIEDSISTTAYDFFMHRGNIDNVFYLADGKRNSAKNKRIYENPQRIQRTLIQELVNNMFIIFENVTNK